MNGIFFVERGAVTEKSGEIFERTSTKYKCKRGDVVGLQYIAPEFNDVAIANIFAHGSSHTGLVEIDI